MKVWKWLDKHFEEIFTFALLVAIALVMFLQVVMRYVFKSSLTWPEEFCRYCFIWLCYMGVSWCVRNNENLRIDILETFFPKLQKPFALLTNVAFIVFFGLMIKPGIQVMQTSIKSGQVSGALRIPIQFLYVSMFISCFLVIIRAAQKIYLILTGKDGKTF